MKTDFLITKLFPVDLIATIPNDFFKFSVELFLKRTQVLGLPYVVSNFFKKKWSTFLSSFNDKNYINCLFTLKWYIRMSYFFRRTKKLIFSVFNSLKAPTEYKLDLSFSLLFENYVHQFCARCLIWCNWFKFTDNLNQIT